MERIFKKGSEARKAYYAVLMLFKTLTKENDLIIKQFDLELKTADETIGLKKEYVKFLKHKMSVWEKVGSMMSAPEIKNIATSRFQEQIELFEGILAILERNKREIIRAQAMFDQERRASRSALRALRRLSRTDVKDAQKMSKELHEFEQEIEGGLSITTQMIEFFKKVKNTELKRLTHNIDTKAESYRGLKEVVDSAIHE